MAERSQNESGKRSGETQGSGKRAWKPNMGETPRRPENVPFPEVRPGRGPVSGCNFPLAFVLLKLDS